jgi:phosphoglycolate phosphatase-like HAD superfamily hydrolase
MVQVRAERKRQLKSISLEQKKVFVFDWDGTILDSMDTKLENFSNVFSKMVGQGKNTMIKDRIRSLYLKLSGRPRKEIFELILERLEMEKGLVDYAEFDSRFMKENKKNLRSAPVFRDAEILLKVLIEDRKAVYISSSMPQAELDYMVSCRLDGSLADGISGILGSSEGFAKGPEHIAFIVKETGCKKEHVLVLGDDMEDYNLCAEAGVDCVLVDRNGRFADADVFEVQNLNILRGLIG